MVMNADWWLYGRRGVPSRNEGVVVINTGLSVVVSSGHVVDIVRDESAMLATVRVTGQQNVDTADLRKAADLLAERARRFLGPRWRVVPWHPTEEVQ